MTPDQQETLIFIGEYAATHGGIAPTYAKMIDNLGGHSKSVYWRRVDRLIAGGYLRRAKGKSYSRSIYLTDQGREYLAEAGAFERIKKAARSAVIDRIIDRLNDYATTVTHMPEAQNTQGGIGAAAEWINRNRDELIDG